MSRACSQPGLKVAVLDDDLSAATSIVAILNRQGFEALGFTTMEALRLALTQQRFDAFVLDWRLGESTAVTLIAELRGSPATADVPIVLLSGNLAVGGIPSDPELAAAIRRYGLEYRAKPYSAIKIAQHLANALSKASI